MDMTDLYDLAALKRKYPEIADFLGQLEPSAADKKSALTQGLLASGLGILAANTGRTPGLSAIGQGALGGLQSYQANIDAARKDRQQRVQTIGGLLGMVQSMQKAKAMQDFFGGGGEQQQPPAPEPMGPPADLAPNFMGPPALPPSRPTYGGQQNAGAAPTAGMPPAAQLITALRSLNVDEGAIAAAKLASIEAGSTKPLLELYTTFGKGATSTGPMYTPTGKFIPSMLEPGIEGRIGPDGQIVAVPIRDYTASRAAIKAAEAGASKASELEESNKRTLGPVNVGNVQVQMPLDRALQVGRDVAARYGYSGAEQRPLGPPKMTLPDEQPPADILRAMQQGARSGMPMRWDAQGGLVAGPEARTGPPRPMTGAPGMGIAPAEGIPGVGMSAEEQAYRTAAAKAPVEQQQEVHKQVTAKTMERVDTVMKGADEASINAPKVARVISLLTDPSGVYGGATAPGVLGLARWANAVGIPFDSKRFQNSQEAAAELDSIGLGMIKTYVGSQNISNADRDAVMSTAARLDKDPEARWQLLQLLARINDKRVAEAQAFLPHVARGGTVLDFQHGWMKSTDKAANQEAPSLTEALAQRKKEAAQQRQQPAPRPSAPQGNTAKPLNIDLLRRYMGVQ